MHGSKLIIMVQVHAYTTHSHDCCASSSPLMCGSDVESDYPALFCGGSASVPRGVVFPPVGLSGSGILSDCPLNSVIVDDKGHPPTNCSNEEPTM